MNTTPQGIYSKQRDFKVRRRAAGAQRGRAAIQNSRFEIQEPVARTIKILARREEIRE
jgi:hypothetical protein